MVGTNIGWLEIGIRVQNQTKGAFAQIRSEIAAFGKNLNKSIGTGIGIDSKSMKATSDSFGVFMKRIDAGVLGAQGQFKNLNESSKQMANGIAASSKQMAAGIGDGVAKSSKHLGAFGTFVGQIGHYISFSIGVQMVMAVKQAILSMIDIFRIYEKTIVNATAVSGYLGKSFDTARESMDAMTRELAGKTIFTATEVAEAMYSVASAGIDPVTASVEELLPILQYAQANQTNLATATQDLLTVLKQFRLGLEDLGVVADTFTTLIASSFLTADKLANAFQYVGQVAGELNQDFRDVASAIALLSDRGYEGGQAGERLNMIFTQLLDPTEESKKTIAALGLSMTDLDPTTNNLIDIFKRLKEANFTAADSASMFRARTAAAMITLVNSVESIEEYVSASKELSGITEMIAERQMATLEGQIKDMKGAFEEAAIIVGGKFTNALNTAKVAAGALSDSLKGIGIPSELMRFVELIASFVTPLTGLLKILDIFKTSVFDVNDAINSWKKAFDDAGINSFQEKMLGLNSTVVGSEGALQKYGDALIDVMDLRSQLSGFITEESRQTEAYQEFTLDLVKAELELSNAEDLVINKSGDVLGVFINQNKAVADIIAQYENYKETSSKLTQLQNNQSSYTQELIDLQQELSRVTSIYGADSEEANKVLNQYTSTVSLLKLTEEELATQTNKATDSEKLYKDAIEALPPQLRATADAAISLIELRGTLFRSQIDYNSALSEYNRLLDIQTNREKYLSEAYLNVYDAQDKLWEIEQKRYDLKEDEETLGQDLFDALADQGSLTDDVIQQYTEWQEAEGELMNARAKYASGEMTEEELATYIENARKEYEDYAGVGEDVNGIAIDYAQNLVDIGAASNDVADSLYDIYDISNDEEQTLGDWEDAVDAVNDAMSRIESIKLVSDQDIIDARTKVDGFIIGVNTALGELIEFEIPIAALTPLSLAEARYTVKPEDGWEEETTTTLQDFLDKLALVWTLSVPTVLWGALKDAFEAWLGPTLTVAWYWILNAPTILWNALKNAFDKWLGPTLTVVWWWALNVPVVAWGLLKSSFEKWLGPTLTVAWTWALIAPTILWNTLKSAFTNWLGPTGKLVWAWTMEAPIVAWGKMWDSFISWLPDWAKAFLGLIGINVPGATTPKTPTTPTTPPTTPLSTQPSAVDTQKFNTVYKIEKDLIPPMALIVESTTGTAKRFSALTVADVNALASQYAVGTVLSWAKGGLTMGPQLSMIGEAGPEAVIPLKGINKKYGRDLLEYIIPRYYPDLLQLQTGGIVGGNYDYSEHQNENYTITGPINITGINNPEQFGESLKMRMRASK